MTKEEIALKLTLARLEKLTECAYLGGDNIEQDQKYNESIAKEAVKLFNTIYSELTID